MVRSTAEFIIIRNEFYSRSYRQIKRVVGLLLTILVLLFGFAIYQNHSLRVAPKYVPTSPDGKLIYMPPVNQNHLLLSQQQVDSATGIIVGMPPPTKLYTDLQPLGENALVIFWATTAIQNMFDYDYIHYRKVIQDSSKYFTPTGSRNFIEALAASKNLETVKARSAVVIPVINGDVKLVGTKMIQGHYSWDLEVPFQLTYESVSSPQPLVQNLIAVMSIARVTTLLSPFYGLAIYRLNFLENPNPPPPPPVPEITEPTTSAPPTPIVPVAPTAPATTQGATQQ